MRFWQASTLPWNQSRAFTKALPLKAQALDREREMQQYAVNL
jgi:hypothetical protein